MNVKALNKLSASTFSATEFMLIKIIETKTMTEITRNLTIDCKVFTLVVVVFFDNYHLL